MARRFPTSSSIRELEPDPSRRSHFLKLRRRFVADSLLENIEPPEGWVETHGWESMDSDVWKCCVEVTRRTADDPEEAPRDKLWFKVRFREGSTKVRETALEPHR